MLKKSIAFMLCCLLVFMSSDWKVMGETAHEYLQENQSEFPMENVESISEESERSITGVENIHVIDGIEYIFKDQKAYFTMEAEANYKVTNFKKEEVLFYKEDYRDYVDYSIKDQNTGAYTDFSYAQGSMATGFAEISISADSIMCINPTKEKDSDVRCYLPSEALGTLIKVEKCEVPALYIRNIEKGKNYIIDNLTENELVMKKSSAYVRLDHTVKEKTTSNYLDCARDYGWPVGGYELSITGDSIMQVNLSPNENPEEILRCYIPYEWINQRVTFKESQTPAIYSFTLQPQKYYSIENLTEYEIQIKKTDAYKRLDHVVIDKKSNTCLRYSYGIGGWESATYDLNLTENSIEYVNLSQNETDPIDFYVPYEWCGKVSFREKESPALEIFRIQPFESLVFKNVSNQDYKISIEEGEFNYLHKNAIGKLIDKGSKNDNRIILTNNLTTIIQNPRENELVGYFPKIWENAILIDATPVADENYSPAYIDFTLKRQLVGSDDKIITDMQDDYTYSVFNKTQNKHLLAAIEGSRIAFNSSDVKSGDILAITTTHKKSETQPHTAEVILTDALRGTLDIVVKEKGSLKGALQSKEKNKALVGILFDNKGKRICTMETDNDQKFEKKYLENGNYTLMAMAASSYLWRLDSLQDYKALGLVENIYYLKRDVFIQEGKMLDVGRLDVPAYDEGVLSFLERRETSITTNVDTSQPGGLIELRVAYGLKETGKTYSNRKIILNLPENAELSGDSITFNGQRIKNYSENGRELTIPIEANANTGVLKLFVKPKANADLKIDAFLRFSVENRDLKEAIGSTVVDVPFVTLLTNSMTNEDTIEVCGAAKSGSFVRIYDGEKLVDTVMASKAGTYRKKISLYTPYDNSVHAIKAMVSDYKNNQEFSALQYVRHQKTGPVLTEFKAFISEHENYKELDLLKENPDNTRLIAYFWPSDPMTFTMKFSDNKQIETVCVTSTKNGEDKRIEAFYDKEKDEWIASGYFDLNDIYYVPGVLRVECNLKKENTVVNIDEPIEYQDTIDTLPDSWKNAKIHIQEKTESRIQATIQLSNIEKSEIKAEVTKEKIKLDEKELVRSGYQKKSTNKGDIYYRFTVDDILGTVSVESYHLYDEMKESVLLQFGFSEDSVGGKVVDQIFSKLFGTVDQIQEMVWKYMEFSIRLGMATSESERQKILKEMEEYIIGNTIEYVLSLLGVKINELAGFNITRLVSYIFKENQWDKQITFLKTALIAFIIDPSGYTYEAVPSNRLLGVKTTIYSKDEKNLEKEWNAEEYNQKNPLITDSEGKYRWDVPEGQWQVKYEKEGYETIYSEWLSVPPPQMDVNIGLVNRSTPAIEKINAYPEYTEVIFDRYLDASTVNSTSCKLLVNGNQQTVNVELTDKEPAPDNSGKLYGKTIKMQYNQNLKPLDKVSFKVNSELKSYCGIPVKMAIEKTVIVVAKPEAIQTISRLNLAYGKTKNIAVSIRPLESAVGKKIKIRGNALINLEQEEYIIHESGIVYIPVKGVLPGNAKLEIEVKGANLKKNIEVSVNTLPDTDVYFDVENQKIWNVRTETTIKEILENLKSQYKENTYEAYDQKGSLIQDLNQNCGTGLEIQENHNGVKTRLTLIISGEATGDGMINIMDMLALQDDILGKEKLKESYAQAADVTGDGVVNIMDMLAIQDHILGKNNINEGTL